MTDAPDLGSAVLALDGGGTTCRLALAGPGLAETVAGGPANVSTDFEGAVAEVRDCLDRLARRVGQRFDAICSLPAYVGLAGVIDAALAERVEAALPLGRVRVGDDRPAAVRGALGQEDGFVCHCGTGSFFAAQTSGRIRLAGGWGPVLGDEASAGWIGRMLLGGALRSLDGRAPTSPLAGLLLERFGGSGGVVRFAATARPIDFGALARLATDHAREGDALARSVMARGAGEIARSLEAIGWKPGATLCLTGGVGPEYESYLPKDMQNDIRPPKAEPLDGAISLARDMLKDGEPRAT